MCGFKTSSRISLGTVALGLDALERRALAAAEATGIPASQVDLTVVPTIKTGEDEPFAPELAFTLTPLQLTMAGDAASLAVGGSSESTPTAESTGPTTATVGLAGREIPVSTARLLALLLALGGLLGAGVVLTLARISAPATETAAIQQRYGQMLVRVERVAAPAGRPVIDVVDFATLANLAERYELLILHWSRSAVETCVVQDQGITYRYRTGVSITQQADEWVSESV